VTVSEAPALVTAEDRAQALGARVDAARSIVARLRSRVSALDATAHEAHVAADFGAAEVALAEVAPLRSELAAAESVLAPLERAQRQVAEHVRVEQHRAALDVAEQRYEAALAEARECLVEVEPGLGAIQRTLRQALAAERTAGQVGSEMHRLRVALGAPETTFAAPSPVRAALESHPLFQAVANYRPGD
jgi:hypothetical protein